MKRHAHVHAHTHTNTRSNVCTNAQILHQTKQKWSMWLELSCGAWIYLQGDPVVHGRLCVPVLLSCPSCHANQVHPRKTQVAGEDDAVSAPVNACVVSLWLAYAKILLYGCNSLPWPGVFSLFPLHKPATLCLLNCNYFLNRSQLLYTQFTVALQL